MAVDIIGYSQVPGIWPPIKAAVNVRPIVVPIGPCDVGHEGYRDHPSGRLACGGSEVPGGRS